MLQISRSNVKVEPCDRLVFRFLELKSERFRLRLTLVQSF